MSRTWSRAVAPAFGLLLALGLLLTGAAASSAADGDHPPDWCFRTNAQGDLPTCTWDGQRWHRAYEGDPMSAGGGPPGGFVALVVLVALGGVALTVWKVSTARRMARGAGMDPGDATAMTLLSDDGFEATYLAANLRGQTPSPAAPTAAPDAPAGPMPLPERLRRLQELRDQGVITPEEHDARRAAILDTL